MASCYRVKPMDACWQEENIKCQFTCPVHTNAGGYVSLLAQGEFEEAFKLAAEPNPLVSICGRICAHPCETSCRRGKIDEPVAIRALKRFAVDEGNKLNKSSLPKPAVKRMDKVAVIGAGPGGLSCAHDLVLLGYQVTIFEAQAVPGGMLYLGIPEYRLPRDIIAGEAQKIVDLGVELKLGAVAGRDFTLASLRKQGYSAIYLGVGCCQSRALNIPGHDLDGVLKGVDFLLDVNLGRQVKIGQRVLVVGGGNVAIDVARSALRLGVEEVSLVCLESQEEMPAADEEIEEALEEGIVFRTSRGPQKINGVNGKVTGLTTLDVASVFDEQGRFNPTFVPQSERILVADTVILAIGQQADLSFLTAEDGVEVSPRGTITVDPATMATKAAGIFAGGDAAFGPRIAINAIADGRTAARSIHRYLSVDDGTPAAVPAIRAVAGKIPRSTDDEYLNIPRQHVPLLTVDKRVGVTAVELGYDRKAAQREAQRCLQCFFNPAVDSEECLLCGGCVDVCPYDCLKLVSLTRIQADQELQREISDKLGLDQNGLVALFKGISGQKDFSLMIKDEERCVRCGLCAERCPARAMNLVKFDWQEGPTCSVKTVAKC